MLRVNPTEKGAIELPLQVNLCNDMFGSVSGGLK